LREKRRERNRVEKKKIPLDTREEEREMSRIFLARDSFSSFFFYLLSSPLYSSLLYSTSSDSFRSLQSRRRKRDIE
jgi:hypothetical protein